MSDFGEKEPLGKADDPSPEVSRSASLTVCHYAVDAVDARILLATLGLLGSS